MDFSLLNLKTPVQIINQGMSGSLVSNLGIEVTRVDEGVVEGFLLLSEKNCRPGGILHGGANLAFAETLAGLGTMLMVNLEDNDVFGMQVSGSHTGVLTKGKALAEAKIIHRGNKTHIWNVDVRDETGRLISTVRVTNMIVKKDD